MKFVRFYALCLYILFFSPLLRAQFDYNRIYERYKNFEQNKHILIYLGVSEMYGKYDNVNRVLATLGRPQVSPLAELVSCGASISQDRLILGFEIAEYHNLISPGSYSQNGGFEYFYAGYKFRMSRKNEFALLGGVGVGIVNIYTYPPSGVSVWDPKFKPDDYGLYNIRPFGAGFAFLNFELSWTHFLNSFVFAGAAIGMDAIPSSTWSLTGASQLRNVITHEQGTGKAYLGTTFGFRFNH